MTAMETTKDGVASLTAGKMKLRIYPTKRAAGEAAALAVAEELRRLGQLRDQFGVIFATGAAQFDTLDFLTSTPGLSDSTRTIQLLFAAFYANG